jgi:hypothetical protein
MESKDNKPETSSRTAAVNAGKKAGTIGDNKPETSSRTAAVNAGKKAGTIGQGRVTKRKRGVSDDIQVAHDSLNDWADIT